MYKINDAKRVVYCIDPLLGDYGSPMGAFFAKVCLKNTLLGDQKIFLLIFFLPLV